MILRPGRVLYSKTVANLRIPERYRYGLAKIAGLSGAEFWRLFAALKSCPPFIETAEIVTYITRAAPEIDAGDVEKIIGSVSSLRSVQVDVGIAIGHAILNCGILLLRLEPRCCAVALREFPPFAFSVRLQRN